MTDLNKSDDLPAERVKDLLILRHAAIEAVKKNPSDQSTGQYLPADFLLYTRELARYVKEIDGNDCSPNKDCCVSERRQLPAPSTFALFLRKIHNSLRLVFECAPSMVTPKGEGAGSISASFRR